jgi:hypothetical protein
MIKIATALITALFLFGCAAEAPEKPAAKVDSANLPANAETKSTAAATPLPEKYVACGCGCCGGVEPVKKCLYRKDDLGKIIEEDRKSGQRKECDRVGCAAGIEYRYCDR